MPTSPPSASAGPTAPPVRLPVAVAAGALIVATLAAYHGAFRAPFVFDDLASIVDNPTIRDLSRLGEVFHPPHAGGETVGGRPVLNLTFALNYAVGGLAPWGYHAVNLAIHLAAGLLLFGLVRRTLAAGPGFSWSPSPAVLAAAPALALAVSGLWILHPLQTESVTYVAQRAESLAACLILGSVYAFVRASGSTSPFRWHAVSVAACLVGLGVKETVVVTPLLILLFDRTFVSGTFRAAWTRHRWVYFALAATWLGLIALLSQTGGARGGTAGLGHGMSPWSYALTQARALVHYLRLAVWPQPLVFDYGIVAAPTLRDVVVQGILVVAALVGTGVALVRRPALGFVGAFFFVVLAPSSSFVPVASQPIAEHRLYLALAAPLLLAVLGLHRVLRPPALVAWGLLALVAALAGIATSVRNTAYVSALALWSDTVAHAPANARAHCNLGEALAAAGRLDEAIDRYETALHLEPGYAIAHHNLGAALLRADRAAHALPHLELALRALPGSAEVANNYGRALAQLGRPREAVPVFERALALAPAAAHLRYNLANARLRLGDLPAARADYEAALLLRPDHVEAHVNLATTLVRLGRPAEAVAHFAAALRLAPGDVGARIELSNTLVAQGRLAEAIPHYERVLALRPDLAPVRDQLARLRAAVGPAKSP